MERLARELRSRPLLREAVRRGELSARKATSVLPVARGESEAQWVGRARSETVRALDSAVREMAPALAQAAEAEDEVWERLSIPLSPEQRATVDEAMVLAGTLLGPTAPNWQRLEVISQEFLGAYPTDLPADESALGSAASGPLASWLESAKQTLEEETRRWAYLDSVQPCVAPPAPGDDGMIDPRRLDEELRQLIDMRNGWDDVLGHLAMLLRMLGLWSELGFVTFGHYCAERLGLAERTVEQRAALARRLYALPALKRAMRERRLSYEQARLIAGRADDTTIDAWITRAEGMTCIALRRELEAQEEAQMCARGELELRVPRRVALLLAAAFQGARAAASRWLTPSDCLVRVAQHFIDTWKSTLAERSTPHRRVLLRDRSHCQVPGCSRAAVHAHHVLYRSHGGGDEPENLVSLCVAHHLHGVHRGFVQVRGRAPDRLRWQVGVPPMLPRPLQRDGGACISTMSSTISSWA